MKSNFLLVLLFSSFNSYSFVKYFGENVQDVEVRIQVANEFMMDAMAIGLDIPEKELEEAKKSTGISLRGIKNDFLSTVEKIMDNSKANIQCADRDYTLHELTDHPRKSLYKALPHDKQYDIRIEEDHLDISMAINHIINRNDEEEIHQSLSFLYRKNDPINAILRKYLSFTNVHIDREQMKLMRNAFFESNDFETWENAHNLVNIYNEFEYATVSSNAKAMYSILPISGRSVIKIESQNLQKLYEKIELDSGKRNSILPIKEGATQIISTVRFSNSLECYQIVENSSVRYSCSLIYNFNPKDLGTYH